MTTENHKPRDVAPVGQEALSDYATVTIVAMPDADYWLAGDQVVKIVPRALAIRPIYFRRVDAPKPHALPDDLYRVTVNDPRGNTDQVARQNRPRNKPSGE